MEPASLLNPISSLSIDSMGETPPESRKNNVSNGKNKKKSKSNDCCNSVIVAKDEAYLISVTEKRIKLFESIKIEQANQRQVIGGESIKTEKKWVTTPDDIAKKIYTAKELKSKPILISEVNGSLWDTARPFEGDCQLKLFTFDSDEGRDTFWHSSAHVLGEGFYYDAFYGDLGLNEDHFKIIKNEAEKVVARPEKYLGEISTWDKAESALAEALNEFGRPWKINEGDGAFYGPKIDTGVFDALKIKFQCATLQLDFHLPSRFNLSYSAEHEALREKPVMIHRAILGSVERKLAILLEHYKGKWPFWLSPRQAIVCPISEKSNAYALKILEAQLAQYNYMLVVGEAEANNNTV